MLKDPTPQEAYEKRFRKESEPAEFTEVEALQERVAAWRAHCYGNLTPVPRPTSEAALQEMRNQSGWQIRLRGRIYECLFWYGPLTQKEAVTFMWAGDAPANMRSNAAERSIGRQFCSMERAGAIVKTDRRKDMITGRLAYQYEVTGKVVKEWAEEPLDVEDEELEGIREKVSLLSQANAKKDQRVAELTRMVMDLDRRCEQYKSELKASYSVCAQLKKELDFWEDRLKRKAKFKAIWSNKAKAQDAKAGKIVDTNQQLF